MKRITFNTENYFHENIKILSISQKKTIRQIFEEAIFNQYPLLKKNTCFSDSLKKTIDDLEDSKNTEFFKDEKELFESLED